MKIGALMSYREKASYWWTAEQYVKKRSIYVVHVACGRNLCRRTGFV